MSRINKSKSLTLTSESVNNNGFTIIEVALVLAIAGLIFLVVFLALPALQNSQKDTERRQVIGSLVSGLMRYESDNSDAGTVHGYEAHILNYAKLPTGYTITYGYANSVPTTTVLPTTTNIAAATYGRCGSNTSPSATTANLFVNAGKSNEAAFAIKLSNGSYYCKDVE